MNKIIQAVKDWNKKCKNNKEEIDSRNRRIFYIENWREQEDILNYIRELELEGLFSGEVKRVYESREEVKSELAIQLGWDEYKMDDELDDKFEELLRQGIFFEESYGSGVLDFRADIN